MKKLLLVAAVIAATSAVAQPQQNSVGRPSTRGLQPQQAQIAKPLKMFGNLSAPVVVGTTVTVAVAASVISNGNGDAKPEVPKTLKCEGTDPLVNNVCVRTTEVTTVTGTGTGTGTATTTVVIPVTSTYAPTLG